MVLNIVLKTKTNEPDLNLSNCTKVHLPICFTFTLKLQTPFRSIRKIKARVLFLNSTRVTFILPHRENQIYDSPLATHLSNNAAVRLYSAHKNTDIFPSSSVSQSIKASLSPIMIHCSGTEGRWWPGLIVSEPCLFGWTENLLIYIRLIPASTYVSTLVTKERWHMLILCPKTDWSHSTQIPAEERHYYLCSAAQWHISKRQCGGWTKSLGVCVFLWLSLLMSASSQWQFRKKRWSVYI